MALKQDAWSKILQNKELSFENGVSSPITAREIKRLSGEEPRLVSSMDSRNKLPPILKEKGFFVLPVKNGVYKLVKGDGFHDLEPIDGSPAVHESTLPFELATATGQGEDRFVRYSYNTGLLSRFTGINKLFQSSSARKYSNEFTFYVGDSGPITAQSVQFQVDGLFEGNNSIVALEAKADERNNFLVRQLYYPYRFYREGTGKAVRCLFFLYDGNHETYNFWEYSFSNPQDYSSIELENAASYRIKRTKADLDDYASVEKEETSKQWNIPQADSVHILQEFPFAVATGVTDYKKMAKYFDFDERQSNYYREAAEIIGLVALEDGKYSLTSDGERFVNLRPDERNKFLLHLMLRVPIINEVFRRVVRKFGESNPYVSRNEIAEIIKKNSHLTGKTPGRRAKTILSWMKWISANVGVVKVEKDGIRLYL